ncbi:MAG: IS66 family transposase [archaeon]
MTLEEENNRLRKENELLKKALKKERQEKDKIVQDKKKLEKEFEEYKAKHAHTVEELKQALHIKTNNFHIQKQAGAQKGHKGYQRHVPERIDNIKELKLCKCPDCRTKLGKVQEIRSRYVTDIKLISQAYVTQYNISRYYCPSCKKLVEKQVPNVLPHAKFGLNLMLVVMYLRLGLRIPFAKIVSYFWDMHQIKISQGEIVCILKQLVNVYGEYYSWLEKIVKKARVKHTDTTSWRVNSLNYYIWVFVACGVVLYKIRKHNNTKTAMTVFGKTQKGMTLVIDRFSALRALAEAAGFLIQYCWSHILSDSRDLAKHFGAEGKYVHKKLKNIYQMAKSLNHKGTPEHVEQLKAEIFQLTQRHYKHHTVRKFVNNLYYRDGENLFRFVTDKDIDSTNNISERELRALVIIRKISFGSRSTSGAHTMAMLLSVIQTLRLNNCNLLDGLKQIACNTSGY